jgi:peptide/nickel transport system permease protein
MHYILPFTAVFLRYLYLPSLIMRTSIVEVLDQDFVLYQRLVGRSKLNRLRQLAKHASLPVLTIYPISMTQAISGLILIETVFNWPGLGFELFKAILNRDFPVLQFVFFIIAVFIIISNFLIDILYGVIDPRVSIDD